MTAPPTPAPGGNLPKTPAQKHAQARQGQAMTRFGGMLLLFFALGIPAFVVGMLLYVMVRRSRQRLALLALGLLVSLVVVGLGYPRIIVELRSLQQIAEPYLPAVRQLARQPTRQNVEQLRGLLIAVWPGIRTLWLIVLPLAPLLAVHLETSRVKTVSELREQQAQHARDHDRQMRREAAQKVKQAPEAVKDLAVIGASLGGDLGWIAKEWAIYSATMLNRHAVIIGGSGTGKTEFILRVAYLARKIYHWKVFYIDAKGDRKTARRFQEVMQQAGGDPVPLFPDAPYNGWVGDATAILNRMMSVEAYSEPYYKAVAKTVLTLAIKADSGPPRTSKAFLGRLRTNALQALYTGQQNIRTEALNSLTDENIDGVLRRYFGFFDSLDGKLDGEWSFDTVDAGYLLLEGLALKEEARSLGRYLLEDFANYASKRKPPDQQVLLIIDEFSALSQGGADAANLFERLRSFGAGVMVTSQTGEGLGEDARKLIGAAAVTIAFQCADAAPIAERAGSRREVQSAYQVELPAVSGRNPLTMQRDHLMGTGMQREQEVPMLHPDVIRRLAVGECCIIANGAYQTIRVAQTPHAAPRRVSAADTPTRQHVAIAIPPSVRPRAAVLLSSSPSEHVAEQAQEDPGEQEEIEELDLEHPANERNAHAQPGASAVTHAEEAHADQCADEPSATDGHTDRVETEPLRPAQAVPDLDETESDMQESGREDTTAAVRGRTSRLIQSDEEEIDI